MPDLDDFEVSFDGAMAALVAEVVAEMEAVPPERRDAVYLAQTARRLANVIETEMPDCLVAHFETSMAKILRRRAKARKASPHQTL